MKASVDSYQRRLLALGAVAGPALLTLAWIILGLLVPPTKTVYGIQGGVSGTLTSPISGIGVGPYATLFNAAFILSGLLTIAGLIGTFRSLPANAGTRGHWLLATLLALSPLGFVVAGIFTLAGSVPLHMVGFLLAAGTPVVTFAVAGLYFRRLPRSRGLGNSLLVGSPITLLLVVAFLLAFDRDAIASGRGLAGIPSRLLALEIAAYYAAIGWLGFISDTAERASATRAIPRR